MDGTLTDTASLGQSGPGNNVKEILFMSQIDLFKNN